MFRPIPLLAAALALPAWAQTPDNASPEAASGYTAKAVVESRRDMITTANPLASDAGLAILAHGGSAVDAAIAAQLVLGLTEPQSSGIGGGAFMLYWDGKALTSFDGRETAPAAATPTLFQQQGKAMPFYDAVVGGRSVGVPGVIAMLELAHRKGGRLPWKALFQPAIRLAEQGFPLSPRLHTLLADERFLRDDPVARAYFYQADGSPRPVGTLLKNPDYAATLRRIADGGAAAFYQGDTARAIVAKVNGHARNPGQLSLADLAAYRAQERPPLCGPYRGWKVCGMGAPSSGGVAVLQMLGVMQRFDLAAMRPTSPDAVHLFAEAGRLAFADRSRYLADPAFVAVPSAGLIDAGYLKSRSALISMERTLGEAAAGTPPGATQRAGRDTAPELPSTSHLNVVDRDGRVVSMTTSIEDQFGSRLMVDGFLLNNQLTDFSFSPEDKDGPVANRVEPGKRPRSSMAPTLVFDTQGRFYAAVGSPGGSRIIGYVTQTLLALLDWKLDPQQAVSLPHYGSRNGPVTELEAGQGLDALAPQLTARGQQVKAVDMTSGLSAIVRGDHGWLGGADPRREGTARGH